MTPTPPDKLAERIGKIRDRVSHVVALASPSPALLRANEGAYAALETLLAVHAPTAYTRYTEPCAAHLWDVLARRNCPDCVKVERNGCDKCRDENGNPAKPEDCEVRKIIAACLTRTVSASCQSCSRGEAGGGYPCDCPAACGARYCQHAPDTTKENAS